MVSQKWIRKMQSLADKEQKWGRVRRGSRVSPEEDALAGALIEDGFSIRRQAKVFLGRFAQEAGVPYYRTDFVVEGKLVIEVDSFTHQRERGRADKKRDEILMRLGYPVLRLTNDEIRDGIGRCVRKINLFFQTRGGQPLSSGRRFP